MKPDYGLKLLEMGIRKNVTVTFASLSVSEIYFVAPKLYSIMCDYPHGDTIYALSFDFDDQVLSALLSKIGKLAANSLLDSAEGKQYPYSAVLPHVVTLKMVESHLGEFQSCRDDKFVPFVITRLE